MNFRISSILYLIQILQGSVDAYINWGFCPFQNPTPVMNFDIGRYAGNWYEITRDKDLWYENNLECVTATYIKTSRLIYQIDVNNRNYKNGAVTDPTFYGFTYSWARCDQSGNCNVKFWWYPEGNYQVLATDYDNYALVYGCDNWGIFYTNQAWILSRKSTLPDSTIQNLISILKAKVPDYVYPFD